MDGLGLAVELTNYEARHRRHAATYRDREDLARAAAVLLKTEITVRDLQTSTVTKTERPLHN
jgi:hypothetical protein